MRIIVQGTTVEQAGERLARAAAGLAARGHEVYWLGNGLPAVADLRRIERVGELPGHTADVVVAGGAPCRAAALAWRAHARVQLLGTSAARLAGWTRLDRWAWESIQTLALIEEAEADGVRAAARGLPLDRFALWSADVIPAECPAEHPDVEILERAAERGLARSTGRLARSAAFVDRDGTLVAERGYLSDPEALELLPGVPAALRELHGAGVPIVVISNQAGVGRGLFSLARVHATMARMRRMLRAEGVELDAIYFCPHAPDAGCACRKPGTLLLERAAENLQLSLRASMMAGDKRLDAATGQAAGGFGVLVRTGYGREEEALIGNGEFARMPDFVCDELRQAGAWMIGRLEADFG